MSTAKGPNLINHLSVTLEERRRIAAQTVAELNQLLASDEQVAVRERLHSLDPAQGSIGEQRVDVFLGLCDSVRRAFDNAQQEADWELLANAATPDLVRHIVNSLQEFQQSSRHDNRALARSFRLTSQKGKHGKFQKRAAEMVESANVAFRMNLDRNKADRERAYKAAVDAAYDVFRVGEAGAQDEGDYRQTMRDIETLLSRSGLESPRAIAALLSRYGLE